MTKLGIVTKDGLTFKAVANVERKCFLCDKAHREGFLHFAFFFCTDCYIDGFKHLRKKAYSIPSSVVTKCTLILELSKALKPFDFNGLSLGVE